MSAADAADFPSGEWTGFYVYSGLTNRFLMDLELTFSTGQVVGSGWDDIGAFDIRGSYCAQSRECNWVKHYHGRHSVEYRGFREGKGIWGTWSVGAGKGGFHIWPLRSDGMDVEEHEEVEERVPVVIP